MPGMWVLALSLLDFANLSPSFHLSGPRFPPVVCKTIGQMISRDCFILRFCDSGKKKWWERKLSQKQYGVPVSRWSELWVPVEPFKLSTLHFYYFQCYPMYIHWASLFDKQNLPKWWVPCVKTNGTDEKKNYMCNTICVTSVQGNPERSQRQPSTM